MQESFKTELSKLVDKLYPTYFIGLLIALNIFCWAQAEINFRRAVVLEKFWKSEVKHAYQEKMVKNFTKEEDHDQEK